MTTLLAVAALLLSIGNLGFDLLMRGKRRPHDPLISPAPRAPIS